VKTPPGEPHLVLLRLSGEISTKGRATRRQFVTQLLRNLKDALASEGYQGEVERRHDRIFVEVSSPEAISVLERVFGFQSLSPVLRRPGSSLEEIVAAGREIFRGAVPGKRFAVRARFVGDREGACFRPRQVEVELGEALRRFAERVDLEDPEVTAHVEIYRGQAYFFSLRRPGRGGLPVGSGDRAVALVSGGFDSAVAAWQLLKRGVTLDYVFCNLGGASLRLGALRVVKVIAARWSYGSRPRLHAIDFDEVSRELRRSTAPRYWQVLLKRSMLRSAEAIARECGGCAIATGEALGQVSSQTLRNLATISQATPMPILRPLLGFNKDEIIAMADQIGTGPLSAVVAEYCSMVSRRPSTGAKLEAILEEESRIDPAVLERAIARREVVDLRELDPDESDLGHLERSEIPSGASVIDLRSEEEFRSWHYPDAVRLDFGRALAAYPSFARDCTYLLYCELGLKSALLAELMVRDGLRAYHFRGGTRALRRHCEGMPSKPR
jgi:thiamine biosynthesis protein ThiI